MFAVYVSYLLIGALIFVNLEETEDERARNESFQHAKLTQGRYTSLFTLTLQSKSAEHGRLAH